MKQEFALDPGPKRLKITYPWNLVNAEVFLDGQKILSFPTKADFQRGTTRKLPDGSVLSVRFGPAAGAPLMKGVQFATARRSPRQPRTPCQRGPGSSSSPA